MKKAYAIIICVYLFSGIMNMINDPRADGSGSLFEDKYVTETGIEVSEDGFNDVDSAFATITETGDVESADNQFSLWDVPGMIWKAAKFVLSTFIDAHLIYFILRNDYGVPAALALVINGAVGMVQAYGYMQLISNRGMESMK